MKTVRIEFNPVQRRIYNRLLVSASAKLEEKGLSREEYSLQSKLLTQMQNDLSRATLRAGENEMGGKAMTPRIEFTPERLAQYQEMLEDARAEDALESLALEDMHTKFFNAWSRLSEDRAEVNCGVFGFTFTAGEVQLIENMLENELRSVANQQAIEVITDEEAADRRSAALSLQRHLSAGRGAVGHR